MGGEEAGSRAGLVEGVAADEWSAFPGELTWVGFAPGLFRDGLWKTKNAASASTATIRAAAVFVRVRESIA